MVTVRRELRSNCNDLCFRATCHSNAHYKMVAYLCAMISGISTLTTHLLTELSSTPDIVHTMTLRIVFNPANLRLNEQLGITRPLGWLGHIRLRSSTEATVYSYYVFHPFFIDSDIDFDLVLQAREGESASTLLPTTLAST